MYCWEKFIFIIWENVMMDQKWQHLIRELLYPCTPPSSPCPPYPLNSEPRLKHRNYIFKWNGISALICNILYQQEILTFSNINFVEERIISTAFVYRIFFFLRLPYWNYFRVIICTFASCIKVVYMGGIDKTLEACDEHSHYCQGWWSLMK